MVIVNEAGLEIDAVIKIIVIIILITILFHKVGILIHFILKELCHFRIYM